MRFLPIASISTACLLGASVFALQDAQPSVTKRKTESAGALFRKNCTSCHQPPDAAFATDRAWLGQVLDTA